MEELKLTKNYLTKEEIQGIIMACMNDFDKKGLIEGLNFDYLGMELSFIDYIGVRCIDGYNEELRDKIYNEGLIDYLMENIKNAKYTHNLLYVIADKKINSLSGILNKFLNDGLKNLDLSNLDEILPKLEEAMNKYNEIIGKNKNEEGETK